MADAPAVLGAGGHGAVVVSTLIASGLGVCGVYDDDPKKHGRTVLGIPVTGGIGDVIADDPVAALIAIGNNADRKRIALELPVRFMAAVHPTAVVGADVDLGPGAVVFAGAVVQPRSTIGDHAIVNTGCVIDHDCCVGAFALVGSGATLAGGVRLGEGALIGAGATVGPGITVGAWAVVGAGGAVVTDVPAGETVAGVPAKSTVRP